MKKFVILVAAMVGFGFVNAASAADMPVKAVRAAPMAMPYSWTGVYVGAEGGYAWGRTSLAQGPVANINFAANGGFGGGTLGVNWQIQNWVLGLEGDISAAGIESGGQPSSPTFACTGAPNCQTSSKWFGTARGRVGYAWDRWLVYGTGGWIYGNVYTRINGGPTFDDGGLTRSGWTAGGGVEWAFAGNWSAKLEYLHADFGTYGIGTSTPTPVGTLVLDMGKVGINYKFWGMR